MGEYLNLQNLQIFSLSLSLSLSLTHTLSLPLGNIAPRAKAMEAKRLVTPIVEPPPAQYWVQLTANKCKWEKYLEDT